jgi:hypothetical protein
MNSRPAGRRCSGTAPAARTTCCLGGSTATCSPRQMANRELAETLGVSAGSVRNELLYPEPCDLLLETTRGRCTDGASPEAYVWQGQIYTERATLCPPAPLRSRSASLAFASAGHWSPACKVSPTKMRRRLGAEPRRRRASWRSSSARGRRPRPSARRSRVLADVERRIEEARAEGQAKRAEPAPRQPEPPPENEQVPLRSCATWRRGAAS